MVCVFLCRSFSDSCFLSSPLCSELADVQWYGHDKAKPGTLVWDLLIGPRKVPLPSPTASVLPWLDWRTGHEPLSSLNPALHPSHHLFIMPLYHSSAGQGHTCCALIRADFTGQTEKCHLSCWTVAIQPAPQSPFFTHPQHTSKEEKERWEERAQKNIKHTTQTQQNQHRPFQDVFHILSLVPRPKLTPVHCHPIRGYLLDLSHQFKTHPQA